MIKIGTLVVRKSYNKDIVFEVTAINNDIADLSGYTIRLLADSPISDLEVATKDELNSEEKFSENMLKGLRNPFEEKRKVKKQYLPGRILHIDGDKNYLYQCHQVYKKMNIPANCFYIRENELADKVIDYIIKLRPDIIIITGHDSYNKDDKKNLKNYRNSSHFVKAVRAIRSLYLNNSYPIIIAGACQSHFEALIGAGANFASSPARVNVHALDPSIIGVKCSITQTNSLVDITRTLEKTKYKTDGYGGTQTNGTLRLLYF